MNTHHDHSARAGIVIGRHEGGLTLAVDGLQDLVDETAPSALLSACGDALLSVRIGETSLDLARPEHRALWQTITRALLARERQHAQDKA